MKGTSSDKNPPAILPWYSCSDTKNGTLHFGHQVPSWVKQNFLHNVEEVASSHTSDVTGREVGHNPQSQAAATPETDKECAESSKDTSSDGGKPTSKQVVYQVGVCSPGHTPGQLYTCRPAVEHLAMSLTHTWSNNRW